MAPYTSSSAAYSSKTFSGQLFMTMLINFGINFGWEWWAMSSKDWPGITAFNMHTSLQSCLALDMFLTPFLIGTLCSLAGTPGTQQEVKDKKCEVLDPQVFDVEVLWRYTPVVIRGLTARSFALGLYTTVVLGLPSFLIAWASIGSGVMGGMTYTIFKGIWATCVSAFVYTLVFPPAIDKRNFPELEFLAFSDEHSTEDAPPMVGRPSFI